MYTHENWVHLAEFDQRINLTPVFPWIGENLRIGFRKLFPTGFLTLEIILLVDLA